MTTRRWRDPRDGLSWEVSVSRVGRLGADAPASPEPPVTATVTFDLLTTPKRGFRAVCCYRAESLFPRMQDQEMALCLEAARRGGRLWVDPRDGELWWVQGYGHRAAAGDDRPVVFNSVRSAVGARAGEGRAVTELTDDELAALLDAGRVL